MRLRSCWVTIGLVLTLAGVTSAAPAVAVETPNGPVHTVMNTSESPPDGVWFRSSARTGDTNRVTGHGVYMGERVQLRCFAWGDSVGGYANRLWYKALNVSRPSNAGVENSGFLNAHYVNDGLLANQIADGVPDCEAAASPSVSLAQGPAAPAGYRYAIALNDFPVNSSVSISCRDSVNPNGFYTFSLNTNSAGAAGTASYCYSGDGPEHWVVVAGGISSNRVVWEGQSTGPGTPRTPIPPATPSPTTQRPTGNISFPALPVMFELPVGPRPRDNSLYTRFLLDKPNSKMHALLEGCRLKGWINCYNYGKHYLSSTGTDVNPNMADLIKKLPGLKPQYEYWLKDNAQKRLNALLANTPNSSAAAKRWDTAGNTQNWAPYVAKNLLNDWTYTLENFSVRMVGDVWIGPVSSDGSRPVQLRYRYFMFDKYDFDGPYADLAALAEKGWAAEFLVKGASALTTISATTRTLEINNLVLR